MMPSESADREVTRGKLSGAGCSAGGIQTMSASSESSGFNVGLSIVAAVASPGVGMMLVSRVIVILLGLP